VTRHAIVAFAVAHGWTLRSWRDYDRSAPTAAPHAPLAPRWHELSRGRHRLRVGAMEMIHEEALDGRWLLRRVIPLRDVVIAPDGRTLARRRPSVHTGAPTNG
jgi:hypothetical protein